VLLILKYSSVEGNEVRTVYLYLPIVTHKKRASEGSVTMKEKFSISPKSQRSLISIPSHEVTTCCPLKNCPLQYGRVI
jgi:hypothetical protein